MRKHHFSPGTQSKQSGVVMFVALILLLILSLLGVTAARMQTVEERMARNDNNREIGAQAAEAALRATRNWIAKLEPLSRTFGGTNGLYAPVLSAGSPLIGMDWTNAANTLAYTNAAVAGPALTALPVVSQNPKIVVEQMISTAIAGADTSVASLTPTTPIYVYRVTAQGVGADGTSTTTLQTIVR